MDRYKVTRVKKGNAYPSWCFTRAQKALVKSGTRARYDRPPGDVRQRNGSGQRRPWMAMPKLAMETRAKRTKSVHVRYFAHYRLMAFIA